MEILLRDIAKQYGRETVLEGLTLRFPSGSRTAILGPNGSGKSTFLQLIGGAIVPTQGTIEFKNDKGRIEQEELYRYISIAAPYLGLYEDLSLKETLVFHGRFKPFRKGIGPRDVAGIAYLDHAMDKPVLQFSSGMKQRLKLALAILSETPLLLLDEPSSNLDAEATAWFREILLEHGEGRTLFVASNRQTAEHDMCEETVEVGDWKRSTRSGERN